MDYNKSMKLPSTLRKVTIFLIIGLALNACAAPPGNITSTPSAVVASPSPPSTAIPIATTAATQVTTLPPPQVTQILDLAFAGRIWVLAATQEAAGTGLALLDSPDNGVTWEAHPIPGAQSALVGEAPAPNTARYITFLNQDIGWVYGPGLFATHDGGRTWQQVNMNQEVVAITPLTDPGEQTWALTVVCPSTGGNCTYHLLGLDTQTDAWQQLSNFAALNAGPGAVLLRPDSHSAVVLALDLSIQVGLLATAFLWTSSGSGVWMKLSTPCQQAVQELLSISPEGQYWMLCGSGPGAGAQGKEMYISTDKGKTWELRAFTPFAQPTPNPPLPAVQNPLPAYGYTDDMLALSNNAALIGLGRSTIFLSQDGGLNWEAALPIETANPGGNGGWRIIRGSNSAELWASVGTELFRSTDLGSSWNNVNY